MSLTSFERGGHNLINISRISEANFKISLCSADLLTFLAVFTVIF